MGMSDRRVVAPAAANAVPEPDPGLALGIAALRRGEVELFLHLLEPHANPLLVEVPDVAMERDVGLAKVLDLGVDLGELVGRLAECLVRLLEALVEAVDPLDRKSTRLNS